MWVAKYALKHDTHMCSYPRVHRQTADGVILQDHLQIVQIGHARELENWLVLLVFFLLLPALLHLALPDLVVLRLGAII